MITKFLYKNFLRPIFFLGDPEHVHDLMTFSGRLLGSNFLTRGLTSFMFSYSHPALEQEILGIEFKNPIGLSAGFDKDALLTDIMPSVGFGFEEIGSITGEPCEGNPKPRLWRLKNSKSLVVYYGLKNEGPEIISQRLKGKRFSIPIGTSIAKTNCADTVDTDKGIADYIKAFKKFTNIGDYFTINISCPNAFGGLPFTDAGKLDLLLSQIDQIPTKKPIFLKMAPDLSEKELDQIINVVKKHKVRGFICTNLTKDRKRASKLTHKKDSIPENGGLSGKIVEDLSNQMIKAIYQKTKGKYVIIGVGGVFSAEDAYKKIKLGASLVQLITGMIFEGPQLIGEINRGLVKLLQKDGYKNISQAIGKAGFTH
ncbi:quinone-dependent dihydroorotate dehydrogenase [Candidatus Daviesbacteria bacterium]|nr:quinone-dependent dihydroorotate dehydrogenase [Candidatus Daviesbacteria bacterium]